MNSSSITKARNPRRKVVLRCRKLSSTSNKSQGAIPRSAAIYKQRIKVISKNNKELATALQNIRCDLADKEQILDNVMFARMKMIEMHSSMKTFMKDFDQVLCLLNANNVKWPVLRSSLQPRNAFKNKMNYVIESVAEASEPESSVLVPEIDTENRNTIVQESAMKEGQSSPNSKNDEDSLTINHIVTNQFMDVSNEAVFNDELNIDATAVRKREQFRRLKSIPSSGVKSCLKLRKSSDSKSGFHPKHNISPLSTKNTSADSQISSFAARSKSSKIPKMHNILNKAKTMSPTSGKMSKVNPPKKIITENVVKESENFRRLTFVKNSNIQVPDFTSSNDNQNMPIPLKTSDEGINIIQGLDETSRRQTFVVKDLKPQCDRRKTFVKKSQDITETFISNKDRRGTFTVSNKLDENIEISISHGTNNICDLDTAMSFKNETSYINVENTEFGIMKALHSDDNNNVSENSDATVTDSQAVSTKMFSEQNIDHSVESIKKISSGNISDVYKNVKQSKKLPIKEHFESHLYKEKADNPAADCTKLMNSCKKKVDEPKATPKLVDSEIDLCKNKSSNPEVACVDLMGFESKLYKAAADYTKLMDSCKKKVNEPKATSAELVSSEMDLYKKKSGCPEVTCVELISSESELCKEKVGNLETAYVKLTNLKSNICEEKANDPDATCLKLVNCGLNFCEENIINPTVTCAKVMNSEVNYTHMKTNEVIASTEDAHLKLKNTENADKRLPKVKKPRLSKITGNSRKEYLEAEIDTEKPSHIQCFKRMSCKKVLFSESDEESVPAIDFDDLEVPPLKISPVIRRAPKAKSEKVFKFYKKKKRSTLSKSSKNFTKLSSDAVCPSNDSREDFEKINNFDAGSINTQNVKKSKKSVHFSSNDQNRKTDTVCIIEKEINNSVVQQKAFKLPCVQSIAENIEKYDDADCENNLRDNCSSIFDVKIPQSKKFPTKRISSEMECKENAQSNDENNFENHQIDCNFNDCIDNSVCKNRVKSAEVKKKRKKTNDVNKKSKRGGCKNKTKGTVQDVIIPNINECGAVKEKQCTIKTKREKNKDKKQLPVNTFVVKAEIHSPPPSVQDENEMPPESNILRLSVVLSDIFKSEDAKLLNIPSNKDDFLKGRTSFPLKIPLSENSSNLKLNVKDQCTEIPVINLESENDEDLTGARCRRSCKPSSYREPSLRMKMRRFK